MDVEISRGTVNRSLVHPREVFAAAIEHRASTVACVHNHPSGDPAASKDDLEVTRRLMEVGKTMGIPLVDHIVVGSDRFYSFADSGLISPVP